MIACFLLHSFLPREEILFLFFCPHSLYFFSVIQASVIFMYGAEIQGRHISLTGLLRQALATESVHDIWQCLTSILRHPSPTAEVWNCVKWFKMVDEFVTSRQQTSHFFKYKPWAIPGFPGTIDLSGMGNGWMELSVLIPNFTLH